MEITSLPYNKLIGLEETTSDGRKVISLNPTSQHLNHVGTIHACVLFSVAEAASAQALLDGFPALKEKAAVVLRTAEVKYRRPASDTIHGAATIDAAVASAFLDRFEKKGVALVSVSTSVRQGDVEVLSGEYTWFVTRVE